ncbi:MAG TPA: MiaB/RimO family radical SAM methylthiotransferase [Candidatus Absconditabacterales bacterium]|nr:MiaB/RimO family radical SAM methylthiotransferase [Candidatus Absconditabacterales bacterium]
MRKFNFSFINLGCNKNLVDTQFLLGNIFYLSGNNPNYEINYSIDPYDQDVKYVFLNTCGFISSARYEMFETIELLLSKHKIIYLLGCGLYYFENLDTSQMDEKEKKIWKNILDNKNIHFLSRSDWNNISIENLIDGYDAEGLKESVLYSGVRAYTNAKYKFEYLKIAEGCNNKCTFCIIPKIRGKQKSLPMEEIVQEVQNMLNAGIEEIILIAQDTNRYGVDLYGKAMLFELLEELEKIEGDWMYRILYLYPDILTLRQLEKLKKFKKFIPYFDIPLQHIGENILKNMGRFYDQKHIKNLLNFIEKNFETKFVRTNIIVGFPGETEENFQELCEFLEKTTFDNVAIFEYHDEVLADSSKLENKVDESTIRKRFQKVKKILEAKNVSIKNDNNFGYVMGFKGREKDPTIIVRPWLHAPEIDSYDEIKLGDILGIHGDDDGIDIGSKILYRKE